MVETIQSLAAGCTLAFCCALAGCSALRSFSLRKNLLDHPNERSLHIVPVPRLGGLAIAGATWVSMGFVCVLRKQAPSRLVWAVLLSSAPIVVVGLVDDLRPLRARTRFLLQTAIAAVFCFLAGVPKGVPLSAGSWVVLPPAIALVVWVFFIVALLNVFNFMDGMDGLAGTQSAGAAVGIGCAFAALHRGELATLSALVAVASLAFLMHNFPPAKLFMGDAGSTFLGFIFAALGVLGAEREPGVLPLPVVLVALSPFILDGTLTILRRALRREPVWKAHRTHLYQRAVTAGRTHHQVLVVYATWIAAASAGAVYAASGPSALVAASSSMIVALVAMVVWVTALERVSIRQSTNEPVQQPASSDRAIAS